MIPGIVGYIIGDGEEAMSMSDLFEGQLLDLVCGMHMDPEEAPAVTTYGGESYYFCSDTHKEEFERDPEKFLAKYREGREAA